VVIRSFTNTPEYIRRRGEDARKGAVLLPRGARIGAPEIGVCAAVGKAFVRVHRRPRVTILCTGSELRPIEGRLGPHETRDSNGPALSAALAEWGFAGIKFRVIADRPGLLLTALRSALKRCDVVLFTGGVSAGNYDFVRPAVEAAGATIRFHKVAIKPGRPTLYATAAGGRHIFGLPGNPLSVFAAFHEFALPALRTLAGYPAGLCRPGWLLPLAAAAEAKSDRVKCELARLVPGEVGLAVAPLHFNSSADLAAAGGADGIVILDPARGRFSAGDQVTFRPWRPLP
jgi:molybdopterin molybdotransferase